ncbi:MAG: hypothetical protein WCI05_01480 [Myxococcales bacterium]
MTEPKDKPKEPAVPARHPLGRTVVFAQDADPSRRTLMANAPNVFSKTQPVDPVEPLTRDAAPPEWLGEEPQKEASVETAVAVADEDQELTALAEQVDAKRAELDAVNSELSEILRMLPRFS